MKNHLNSTKFVAIVSLAALVLAGCADNSEGAAVSGEVSVPVSGESSRPSSPAASSPGITSLPHAPGAVVVKDQSKWTLPTDPYLVGEWSGSLQMQADSMLTASCMHEAGFPQYIEYWDASAPWSETLAGDGVSPNFNEPNAAKYGYRSAPDPRDLITTEMRAGGGFYSNEPPEFDVQWELCTIQSREEVKGMNFDEAAQSASRSAPEVLPDESGTVESQLQQLQVDWNAPELQQAASVWRACMAPMGIVDLPEHPWLHRVEMPESLKTLWDWSTVGTPSAEEITMAIFDAACRESSGWFDVYFEAEWSTAEAFVNANRAALAPRLAEFQAQADMALAVIQKYSGQE